MNTLASILTLISAIYVVESDCGVTSNNHLQITPICLEDTNRILSTTGADWRYCDDDRFDFEKSRAIAVIYLSYWGEHYLNATECEPTEEIYARIWNGGPNGWKKQATSAYWEKVKRVLENY